MSNVIPLRRSAADSAWDQADTWPSMPGPLAPPQAAQAATEIGATDDRDDPYRTSPFFRGVLCSLMLTLATVAAAALVAWSLA